MLRDLGASQPRSRDGAQVKQAEPYIREIESNLRAALGARVTLSKGRKGGRIVIRFHSDDELEGIIERLTASA